MRTQVITMAIMSGLVVLLTSLSTNNQVFSLPEIQTDNNFLIYTNSNLGFKIQYDSSWSVKETNNQSVQFGPPNADPNADLRPNVAIMVDRAEQFLDTTDMKVKTKSPQTYVLDTVNFFRGKIVRSTPIKIQGADSAWKVEWTSVAPAYHGERYIIDIEAVKDGKRYNFELGSPSLNIPEELPTFQQMINSIEITK